MKSIKDCKWIVGIEAHSFYSIWNSSSKLGGYVFLLHSFCFRYAHAFSIGLRSALCAGQSISSTLLASKCETATFALCGPQLSCWNMILLRLSWYLDANGNKFLLRISLCWSWFNVPRIRIKGVRPRIRKSARTDNETKPDLNVGTRLSKCYLVLA